MYNYNKIIDQLEAMSPAHQDEFAQKLLERNGGLAVAISTKINIIKIYIFFCPLGTIPCIN